MREEVDLVVTSDPEDMSGVTFIELFDYNPVFVALPSMRLPPNPMWRKIFAVKRLLPICGAHAS